MVGGMPEPVRASTLSDVSPAGPPDDGTADPYLEQVLARHAAGAARLGAVVDALRGCRLLIPLMQVSADQLASEGRPHEGDTDPCGSAGQAVAVVTMTDREGRPLALAFSSVENLQSWRPDARPLPRSARDVAAAALASGAGSLLIDAGGPATALLRGAWLARVAAGEGWPQPWADPYVARAVACEVTGLLGVTDLAELPLRVRLLAPDRAHVDDGPDDPELPDLVVVLEDQVGGPQLAAAAAPALADRLATSDLMSAVFVGNLAVTSGEESK